MSLVQELLYIVSNYPGGYRTIYDLIFDGERPGSDKEISENTLRVTLSRMKKNGLLKNKEGEWSVTDEGKEFLDKGGWRSYNLPNKRSPRKTEKREVIVIFDIPEVERYYRDWLRGELTALGFEPVQKSVWFGPQLPKEFVEYIKKRGLLKCIRFFRATEKDLV